MPHVPYFRHNKTFFKKSAPSLFCVYWTLTSCRRSIQGKRCYRRRGGGTEGRTELMFIGPSGVWRQSGAQKKYKKQQNKTNTQRKTKIQEIYLVFVKRFLKILLQGLHLRSFLAKFQESCWLAEIIINHHRLNVNSWYTPWPRTTVTSKPRRIHSNCQIIFNSHFLIIPEVLHEY